MNISLDESHFGSSLNNNNNNNDPNTQKNTFKTKIIQNINKNNKSYAFFDNTPKEGIPIENVICSDINLIENLTCCICLNLFWKPMYNLKCNDIFCKYCINQCLKKVGKFCPLCKNESMRLYPAKFINRFFNDIKIKCLNYPCEEIIQYSDYEDHLINKCKYRNYKCLNNGCSFKGILSIMEYHSKMCEFRIIKCEYCEKSMKKCEYEKHIRTECITEIKCKECNFIMSKSFYTSHHKCNNGEMNFIIINKFIRNKSSSYIGYLLSNNCIGGFFNDGSKIILNPITNVFYFIEKKEGKKKETPISYTLYSYPPDLSKKITILNMIKAYFDYLFIKTKIEKVEENDLIYVKRWKNVDNTDVFRLSNNISQIFFQDHTELILNGEKKTIIYKNEKQEHYICLMNKSLKSSNSEMVEKLKFGLSLIYMNHN